MKKRFKKIYIEITNKCNLTCSFCPKTNRDKKEMSLDEFETVLTRIKDYTDYIYLHVKGEPLLHCNLEGILKLCTLHKFKVNITTNGCLIDKNEVTLLTNKCIRQVNFSLHAQIMDDEKIYLARIISFSKKAIEKNIIVSLRFWRNNVNKEIVKILKEEFNYDGDINKKCVKINNNLFINKDDEFNWPSLERKISKQGNCYGLKTHIGILSNGTVIPCCLDQDGIINLGNIFDENLEDILNQERVIEMIKNFNNNKREELLCQKCDFM